MLCADFGAKVLRVDRPHPQAHTDDPPPPTADQLTRRKASICVNMKKEAGRELIKIMIPTIDILIDPFRPGVLEKMGLGPEKVLLKLNPRLIVARMTGFRRDGKYKDMAGHDINYIAVSGVLSMLGRQHEKPYPPLNLMGDFAGGGAICFLGIVLALLHREKAGYGQVVEANMADGSAHLATMPRLATKMPVWNAPRGTNQLDGGCPFYDTYETKDGLYMAVGALEPQFYAELMKGLELDESSIGGNRFDKSTWPKQAQMFTEKFKSKTRAEWENVFDGTDACCTPVLSQRELEDTGYQQRPIVTLKSTPSLAIHEADPDDRPEAEGQGIGVAGDGWDDKGLSPGVYGENILATWMGWQNGRHFELNDGGLEYIERQFRSKY